MGNIVPMVGLAAFLTIYFQFYGVVFDPKAVAGQRVLITGASSGIGEQLAYQYCRLGAKLLITARRHQLLEKVAKECKSLGAQQVEFVASDLAEQKDRDRLMAEVGKRLGGLDHLILNHAVVVSGPWLGSRTNMTTLLDSLNANFLSHVDLASQAMPALTASKGAIGVVSSIAGKIGVAMLGSYSAEKFALNGFFAALRAELQLRSTGVTVTTCVIGPVDTDIASSEEWNKKLRREGFFGLNVMTSAKDAADAILTGVATRQREIYHGKVAWVVVALHQVFPGLVEDQVGTEVSLGHL